jgi:hypothetical protein
VHTKVPFARRFSVAELKGHRAALVSLVEAETLGVADTDDTDEAVAAIVQEMRAVPKPQIELLPEEVEILTKAVGVEGGMQGMIHFVRHEILDVTYAGYLAADEMLSRGPGFLSS